ncbi:conserved protein of unknown function [Tenacibaculum sp. 190524A02b]|uniref:hypothetical protein n=1 Tax=Tenacibaculum vairaonense TaxID=3137860 RepID=UPI0032B249A8
MQEEQKQILENAKQMFVRQPYLSKQCGQSCLSMITGDSIELIVEKLGKEYTTYIQDDLENYLKEKGYKTFIVVGDFSMKEVPNNSIVRLKKPDNSGHFILKNENGILLDPSVGIVQEYIGVYEISHYLKFEKIA